MKKQLGKIEVFSIVLGSIIGWGAFMLPGTKFLPEAGVINTALGLMLGAFCIIIIEKNYAVMIEKQKDEGGEFIYAYNNLGKVHGFIVGWFLVLAYFTMIPLNASAFPLVIKKLFGNILEIGFLYTVAGYKVYLGEILVSSIIILIFCYLNIKGLKKTSRVQKYIIFILISIVLLIFILMIFNGNKDMFIENYIMNYNLDFGEIAKVFAITPFAFIGFDAIPQLCKEINFSNKKASLVAIISLLMGTLIYNLLNIITAIAYSRNDVLSLEWSTGSAVSTTLGTVFFVLLVIALCAAVWSGINGFIICSSKLMGSMAKAKILPDFIGKLSLTNVYSNSIIVITISSLISLWFGRVVIIWIVDMSSLGATIAYLYVSIISYKICEKKFNKFIAIIGTMISILFILLLLFPKSPAVLSKEAMFMLFFWCILGVIFYFKKSK